jgi:cobalt-zinc-cadmium efflux system membrane fusion protein
MKNIIYIIISFVLLSVSSCSNKNKSSEEESTSPVGNTQSNQVSLTAPQVTNAGIQTAVPKLDTLSETVDANGMIQIQPNSKASINAPFESFIEKIYYLEGQRVKRGQILVSLKHPTFIQMQQEYQQAVSQLTFLQQELERQKTLSAANVSAQKQYQQTKADFGNMRSQSNSLAEKLKMIGINPQSVTDGPIQPIVYLRAPFAGVVAEVTAYKGQSVLPQQPILEVLNIKETYLELNVFEQHINKIVPAQTMTFTVSSFENSPKYEAKITSVGSSLDLTSRTITVIAQFNHQPKLIPGLYVEAQIRTDPRDFYTIPEEALIMGGDSTFIFIESPEPQSTKTVNEKIYDKTPVDVLRISQRKAAIKMNKDVTKNSRIVIRGANYLKSEMTKGEGDD